MNVFVKNLFSSMIQIHTQIQMNHNVYQIYISYVKYTTY